MTSRPRHAATPRSTQKKTTSQTYGDIFVRS